MSPGATADRVYETLRRQIVLGEHGPGERLDPARLAADLNASATPVRDALHQLLGERMVEARAHAGFWVRVESETGLRDLYEWNGDLLAAILRKPKNIAPEPDIRFTAPDGDTASATAELFLAMAAASGNREYHCAVAQAGDRLHAARRAEPVVLGDIDAELSAIAAAWHRGPDSDVRPLIAHYHRRRLAKIPVIASLLRPAMDRRGS